MSLVNPFSTSSLNDFIDRGSRCKYSPGLYLIATPIGNLEDISLRALYTLNHADIIACEDTRVTQRLLKSYGIYKKLISCHEHNWQKIVPQLVEQIKEKKIIAYVTDAGMPLISDPGYELARECQKENLYVTVIPGPSAPLTALVLSGLPCDAFYFGGFLPPKSKARREKLKALIQNQVTLIFFESPHRLIAALHDIRAICPGTTVAVAREMTKIFEETKTGAVEEVLEYYEKHPPKGEIVLLISPPKQSVDPVTYIEPRLQTLMQTMSLKDAVNLVAKEINLPKNQIYNIGLQIKHGNKKTKI